MSRTRKIAIAVRTWGSEEAAYTWKYCKAHLLQAKDSTRWDDHLTILHVSSKKEKEKDRWDVGGPVIPDVQTAVQPYNSTVQELEGDAEAAIVEYVNKEAIDVLVLASRGRNVMKKAMMGSTTEYVMNRVNCACLVVKPMVAAGDTYRMKTAVKGDVAQLSQAGAQAGAVSLRSPSNSPMMGRLTSLPTGAGTTPFNRRVAIAYDTTASGRYLLKWAAENILEPADNVYVVRAVPKVRRPGTSFADKTSVQRLAGDALQGLPHVTTFNLPGATRKAVLAFVAKESIDLLVLGVYKQPTRRKGLGLRTNAYAICNHCASPCMVTPMSESRLALVVRAADLALVEQEEEELGSYSSSGSEAEVEEDEEGGGSGDRTFGPRLGWNVLEGHGLSHQLESFINLRPFENLFKRRGNTIGAADGAPSPTGDGAASARHKMAVAMAGAAAHTLPAGKYLVEVDGSGGVRSIHHAKSNYEVGSPVALSSPRGTTSFLTTTTITPHPPAAGHVSNSYTGLPASCPRPEEPVNRGVSDPGLLPGHLAATTASAGGAGRGSGTAAAAEKEVPAIGVGGEHEGGLNRGGTAAANATAGTAAGVGSGESSLAPAVSAAAATTAAAVTGAAEASAAEPATEGRRGTSAGGARPVVLVQHEQAAAGQGGSQVEDGVSTGADGQPVDQLRRLLSLRELELASLRQQLARLAQGH